MEDKYQQQSKPSTSRLNTAPQNPNLGEEEDQPINAVPLYRRKRVLIPFFILVIAVVVVVWYWYVNLRGYVSTDDAYIDGNSVSLGSKILGKITKLSVDEGDTVVTGQVLVNLDDSDLKAQEEQAKAMLTHSSESVILARTNLDKARDDFQRTNTLFQSGTTTKEQFDHDKKAFEAAQAQYNIALAQVGVARSQLGVIQTQLKNTVITSPIDGMIAKKWAMPGDVIQAGQPVFSIYDLKNIWVTANLEETKFALIKLNDPVEISVDTYKKRHFRGKVFQFGSGTAAQFSLIPPNNASGNFTKLTQRIPVKISISEDDSALKDQPVLLLPGMSVEIKIKLK
ncbi:MAG TPA: HlyD family secretion protein [Terriglobales bacterium]|nr:HlyD family secretion protein [Terriglobales bacterium]